jgi:hypothetical protein
MLQGGHAANALPQSAIAKVNCRIIPGEPADEVKATLVKVLADDGIAVTQIEREVASEPSKLNEEIVGAIEKLSNEFWPGAAVIPVMSTGATDGAFLRNAGIPTYGHSGMAMEPGDAGRIHGRELRRVDNRLRCMPAGRARTVVSIRLKTGSAGHQDPAFRGGVLHAYRVSNSRCHCGCRVCCRRLAGSCRGASRPA